MGKVIKSSTVGELERVVSHGLVASGPVGDSRDQVIELSIAMTRRLIGRVVETEPGVLDEIYARTVDELGDVQPATVRIHPRDRAGSNIDLLAGYKGFEVIDDESVGRGGCIAEASGLKVDSSLDAVLTAFENAMKGSLRG